MNELSKILADLIKKDIKKKDLIDTGAMMKSITVKPKMSGSKINFEVSAVDYFEIVSEKYSIMEDVLKSSAWTKAVEDGVDKIVQEKIKK